MYIGGIKTDQTNLEGDKIILEGIQKARSDMEIIPEPTEFVSHQTPQV